METTINEIRLKVIQPVYKTETVYVQTEGAEPKTEERQVLAKELKVGKWFKKDGITSVEQYVTDKNTVSKTRSIVFDKYSGRFYAVNHNTDDIVARINEKPGTVKSVGFGLRSVAVMLLLLEFVYDLSHLAASV